MPDLVITGATGGIGRALALELASRRDVRLVLTGRDEERLDDLERTIASRGGQAISVRGDLGSLAEADALASRLLDVVREGATLVHNAGVWPSARVLSPEGLESAFVVNHLAPLVLQQRLLEAKRLARVLVVSAGLIGKGHFDSSKTPTGEDFHAFRTYCTTKLCFALAMRDVARTHPELDVLVMHPGVVRTALGDRPGLLGALLSFVKRGWEAPEVCAARLGRVLDRPPRWSPRGEARWQVEDADRPWPENADEAQAAAVRDFTARWLARFTP